MPVEGRRPGHHTLQTEHRPHAVTGPRCYPNTTLPFAQPNHAAGKFSSADRLNPRGQLYTDANIGERVAVRDLLDELRGGGLVTGGPANFNAKDRQAFAEIVILWLAILAMTVAFFRHWKVAGWLLAFVLAWLGVTGGVRAFFEARRAREREGDLRASTDVITRAERLPALPEPPSPTSRTDA